MTREEEAMRKAEGMFGAVERVSGGWAFSYTQGNATVLASEPVAATKEEAEAIRSRRVCMTAEDILKGCYNPAGC